MSKIETLQKNEIVNYRDDEINIFRLYDNKTNLQTYDKIIAKILNAKQSIKIISTSTVSNKILDALYKNSEVRIFIILQSFENSQTTLERFEGKTPALLREVKEVENNLIIIDDIASLTVNTLSDDENIIVDIENEPTKDLNFIFDYYFWNCASKEKLVDKIVEPLESPFPPFSKREQKYINIQREIDSDTIFVPQDSRYRDKLDDENENQYFAKEIKNIIYMNSSSFTLGAFKVDGIALEIRNCWEKSLLKLEDIECSENIVPFLDNWSKTINLVEHKNIDLGSVEAKTIDSMETTKAEFKKESYLKSINYIWEIKAPLKSKNARKSSLYSEFNKLNKEFQQQLLFLEKKLLDLKEESGLLSKWFMGTTRQTEKKLKIVETYKEKNLVTLKHVELENFINKEFKSFYEDIIKSDKDFKEERKRKEANEKWEEEKKSKEKSLNKKKEELVKNERELSRLIENIQKKKELKNELNKLKNSLKDKKEDTEISKVNKEIADLESKEKGIQDKQKEQTKFSKSIKYLRNSIEQLEKEIEDKYMTFNYYPKNNELKNLHKNKSNTNEYNSLELPKYTLPEVGVLFETKDSYYLEISDYDELDRANELSQRYEDKQNYKVVVGNSDE